MKGLYRKKTKKASKLLKGYRLGHVKKTEIIYTFVIFFLILGASYLLSQIIKNLFY